MLSCRYLKRFLLRCFVLPLFVIVLVWFALFDNSVFVVDSNPNSNHVRNLISTTFHVQDVESKIDNVKDFVVKTSRVEDFEHINVNVKIFEPEKYPESDDKLHKNIDQEQGKAEDGQVVDTKEYVKTAHSDNINAPGELGKAYVVKRQDLKSEEERKEFDNGWKNNAYNEFVSNRISLHRSLPDPRDAECNQIQYQPDLPEASVVLTFHNEGWSVLLRSIHSIIDRTPWYLLKEIILVDDFSNMDHLKSPLEEYIKPLKIVRIVRTVQREGLIRARLAGYQAASGKAIIFLDSHIECAIGWIEPLLDPIAKNWSTVVTPVIDAINDNTFKFNYQPASATNVGGFDWSLTFTWHAIPEAEKKRRQYKHYLPMRTPTMAGGLFAIDRKYFEYLGTYDDGMDIWGGENLELSFRIWMCGGSLLTAPCSHVGHIFRSRSPYKWGTKKNVLKSNNVRMAEVWLDEFKEYYYQGIGNDLGEYGDITSRKILRKKLQCKSFEWFLTYIYPEIHVPGEALYSGEIRSKVFSVCLDGPSGYGKVNKPLLVVPCHGWGGNQNWLYTRMGEIRRNYGCFDNYGTVVNVNSCHGLGGNQRWEYRTDNTICSPTYQTCLELSSDGKRVTMNKCSGIDRQIWIWNRNPPKGPVRNAIINNGNKT